MGCDLLAPVFVSVSCCCEKHKISIQMVLHESLWLHLEFPGVNYLATQLIDFKVYHFLLFSHGRLKVFVDGLQNLNVSKWGNQWEALFFGITALSSTFSWQTDLSCAKFCWSSQQRLTRSSHWPLIKIQCKRRLTRHYKSWRDINLPLKSKIP